jgi:hypothetical protein
MTYNDMFHIVCVTWIFFVEGVWPTFSIFNEGMSSPILETGVLGSLFSVQMEVNAELVST